MTVDPQDDLFGFLNQDLPLVEAALLGSTAGQHVAALQECPASLSGEVALRRHSRDAVLAVRARHA